MANRKIARDSEDPKKYRIPVDREKLKDFPDQDEMMIILKEEDTRELDVFQKDIPVELKNSRFRNKKVKWMNNFGLKKKGAHLFEQTVSEYTIELKKISNATYIYHNGAEIIELLVHDVNGDRVQASLTLGDPPVGWVK